jgi:hypothetical protein
MSRRFATAHSRLVDVATPSDRLVDLRRRQVHGGQRYKVPQAMELSFTVDVLVAVEIEEEATMGRGLLLWLIGIPIPIILLIWLFGGLHG